MNREPIKFLIVDDIEENLVALEALLRRDGLTILQARSGQEALELLLVHEVALAFLDVQMPEIDGFELAELMRGAERTKHVPIIFVTAGARDQARMFRGYETGAVDFLFKPIDPRILKGKADVFFELSRQRAELSHALRLNEMFVGVLGHDLRNPLSAIVTGAEVLRAQLTDPRQQQVLRRMVSSSARMTTMIEQLLDLTRARLAGGIGGGVRERIDVAELVRRTVEELRGAHPERAVVVEVLGDAVVQGDPGRVLQLLSNLMGNALQHGTAGTEIVVRVEGDDEEVRVALRNQGSVPPELLPTLFDPFRRQTTPSKSGGLGLGLYIAQEIAQSHGGRIGVESCDGRTTFTVRLPRRASERFG